MTIEYLLQWSGLDNTIMFPGYLNTDAFNLSSVTRAVRIIGPVHIIGT